MKILIVETSLVSNASGVVVHVRNAVEIHNHLSKSHDCRLVWLPEQINEHEQYDIILFVAASFYFEYQKFVKLMDNQKRCQIGWLTNEFELFQNSFLTGRTDFIINNFAKEAIKKKHTYKELLQVNLNTLIISENPVQAKKDYRCCYYGTFRKYRVKYFRKWLHGDVVLSSSRKNISNFAALGLTCKVSEPFSWEYGLQTLSRFMFSLYIEDTKTHQHFNHFANRFYEAINTTVLPFFDSSCMGTIVKEKDYWIPDELVGEPEDLNRKNSFGFDVNGFFEHNRSVAICQKKQVLGEIELFLENLSTKNI